MRPEHGRGDLRIALASRTGFNDLILAKEQREAVLEVQNRLMKQFPVELLVVFGSVARGEDDD
jgi:predicted ATPase